MLDFFTNLGIVAGALLALAAVLKPLYMMVRRVEQVHTKVMVELPTWQEHVDRGLKQLYPNSGTSIHDKVSNTNREVNNMKTLLQDHLNDTGAHQVRQIHASFRLDSAPPGEEE